MQKLSKAVQGIFALIFGMTIIASVVRGYIKYPDGKLTLALVTGLIFTVGIVYLYGFLKEKAMRLTHKEINRIFFHIAGAVLILQIVSAFLLKFTPLSDLGYVDRAARDFCESWDKSDLYTHLPERHMDYFARYTNNQALLVILSLIYSACKNLFGSTPLIAPILVNTAGLHISFLLMYFIAGKIFKDKFTPLFCSILGAGFSVFYTYTPYFYTDSMSMPFSAGSIYLFLSAMERKSVKEKLPRLAFSGLLLAVGYKIKGSVIILIPVYLVYLAATCTKKNRGEYLKTVCILLAGITVSMPLCSSFIKSFDIASESELEEIKFPPEHWVMMGLHDRGGFYINDFWFTMESGNYQQKKEADADQIKNRIKDYGIAGMAKHIAKKVSYTWGDGTYFIGYYLKNAKESNAAKRFVAHSDCFKLYCTAYQTMLLIMILLSFINGAVSHNQGREIFVKILICGVFFFFIIWETRSRYLVNFTPFFIITAAYSIRSVSSYIRLKSVYRRRRTNPHTEKNSPFIFP